MSGFEVFNNAGVSVINSDHKHSLFDSVYNPRVPYVGDYDLGTKFGNLSELGYLNTLDRRKDGFLYWIQFTQNNAWAFPGSDLFKAGNFRVIRTSRTKGITSGYCDVFDSNGQLIWSAASAGTMPRIMGFLDVAPSFDLNNNIASVTPGFNPFFLWGACAGSMSTDGVVAGYSGNLMRWTGSQLQTTWINRNQRTFQQIYNGRGNMKIPYAKFQGYN